MKFKILCLIIIVAMELLTYATVVNLTLLHTNDTHTRFLPFGREKNMGGVSRIATMIEEVRSTVSHVLVLDAGDWSEGSFFHNIAGTGSLELRIKDMMGYDAVVVGNHDYLYSPDFLLSKLQSESPSFPVLMANVDISNYPEITGYIQPYVIKDVGPIKVGILGLTTDEMIYSIFSYPIVINDPIAKANELVPLMRSEGADIIICLSHLGYERDLNELAQQVDGIDIIIGGHSHTRLDELVTVTKENGDKVYIVQAESWYKFLGRLDISYDTDTEELTVLSYDLLPVSSDVEEDPDIKDFVDDQKQAVISKYGNVFDDAVAQTNIDLFGTGTESNLGNLMVDAFYNRMLQEGYDIDAYFMGDNFISDTIYKGTINTSDIYSAFCYGFDPVNDVNATLYKVGITGQNLRLVLGFISVTGLFIHCSSNVEMVIMPGTSQYFQTFKINGEEVDNETVYNIGLNNLEYFTIVALGQQMGIDLIEYAEPTNLEAWRVLKDYIVENSPIDTSVAKIEGRVRTVQPDLTIFREDFYCEPNETFMGNTVNVKALVRNFGDSPAVNAKVTFYYEQTPENPFDDPNYSDNSKIYEVNLPEIEAFGGDNTYQIEFDLDTSNLPQGPNILYAIISNVEDPDGNQEVWTWNNYITTMGVALTLNVFDGVKLEMPAETYHTGDECYLKVYLGNASDTELTNYYVFVLLDVWGDFYFAPSWSYYDPQTGEGVDYYIKNIPIGVSSFIALPSFNWPSLSEPLNDLAFHSAIIDPETFTIYGDFDSFYFSYVPI